MATKSLGLLLATAWLATSPLGAYAQTQILGGLGGTPGVTGKPFGTIASGNPSLASGIGMCGNCAAFINFRETRFTFDIKPSTPLQNLLPMPPWQGPAAVAMARQGLE